MDNQKDVTQDSSPEQVEVPEAPESVREDDKTPSSAPDKKPEAKTVPYERFKKVNDELKD